MEIFFARLKKILQNEWFWYITLTLILLGIYFYLLNYGLKILFPQKSLQGAVYDPNDAVLYQAMMEQARTNHHLAVYDLFTPEPHQPAYVYLTYSALGILASFFKLGTWTMFHLAVIVAGIILLAALIIFLGTLFKSSFQKVVAFGMILYTSGLGFLQNVLDKDQFHELYKFPDMTPPARIFLFPHRALSVACFLMVIFFLLRTIKKNSWRDLILASFFAFLSGLFSPYLFAPTIVFVGLTLLFFSNVKVSYLQRGLRFLVFLILPSIYAIYLLYLLRDPVWKLLGESKLSTFSYPGLIVGYLTLVVLTLYGFARLRFTLKNHPFYILGLWLAVVVMVSFSPLNFKFKLFEGFSIILAILASVGVSQLIKRRWGKIVFGLVITLTIVENLVFIHNVKFYVRQGTPLQYLDQPTKEFLKYLKTTPSTKTILAYDGSDFYEYPAFYVPLWTGKRVYLGQRAATLNSSAKAEKLLQFLANYQDQQRVREFLCEFNIGEVGLGNYFLSINPQLKPDSYDFIQKTWQNDGYTLYKVNLKPDQCS